MLGLGIIGWIIIGGLAGWIGSKIMKTDAQMGIILNIVVGIIGGLIVKVGSKMIDTSIRSKLNSLQNAMKEVG